MVYYVSGKSERSIIWVLFSSLKCLDLKICVIVRFNRIKVSLKILWPEALSETWAEISLEPSPVGEMKPSQGLVPQ